jgi:tripartite-type tricarboxylate transporter receptor subunit TctC
MVPYSGGPAQALSDLMGERVQMLIEGGTALIGAMQSGKLHALAVGSQTRLAEFPDLPAAAETIPDFRSAGWMVMVAPAGTPEHIVRKVIPAPFDQNPCAHWRRPMDMILQGWSTSLFHASQQWSTRSS